MSQQPIQLNLDCRFCLWAPSHPFKVDLALEGKICLLHSSYLKSPNWCCKNNWKKDTCLTSAQERDNLLTFYLYCSILGLIQVSDQTRPPHLGAACCQPVEVDTDAAAAQTQSRGQEQVHRPGRRSLYAWNHAPALALKSYFDIPLCLCSRRVCIHFCGLPARSSEVNSYAADGGSDRRTGLIACLIEPLYFHFSPSSFCQYWVDICKSSKKVLVRAYTGLRTLSLYHVRVLVPEQPIKAEVPQKKKKK